MVVWNDYKANAKARGALALELYALVSTPVGDNEELLKAQLPAHLAYQAQQEAAGTLVFAGPLSDLSGEQMNGAGMIIYRAASFEAARELAENDPMHQSGAREYTLRKWLINEGSLRLDLRLSAQQVHLD